ncbi:hypothetical protein EW146_g10319, partial [Bondarzewia mesenterica]
ASLAVRLLLAILGTIAMQGSIKRFTDDNEHDPYSATRGLFFSHVGWIFYKTEYKRMVLIDRGDLEHDPVVRFQHNNYVPLAIIFGFVLPTALGFFWGDPWGAYIWGGLVSKLLIWHCTFLVNSLAHWDGLQPYSDDNTSRTNLHQILALLTAGEGNHNFHVRSAWQDFPVSNRVDYQASQHAFPHDFRAGPSFFDWDPSKWVILALNRLGFVTGLRRAHEDDIVEAKLYMKCQAHLHHDTDTSDTGDSALPVWDSNQLEAFITSKTASCIILINGFAVDVTEYLKDHPGGAALLRRYSVPATCSREDERLGHGEIAPSRDASWAFDGGLNKHSRAAKRRMLQLRVARVLPRHVD